MGKMFQERRLATHTYDLSPKFDPVKSPFFAKEKLVMEELDQELDLIPPCQSFKFVDLWLASFAVHPSLLQNATDTLSST